MVTAEDFERAVGSAPVNDDLTRVNCTEAGEPGHWMCGWCSSHNLPRFLCPPSPTAHDCPVQRLWTDGAFGQQTSRNAARLAKGADALALPMPRSPEDRADQIEQLKDAIASMQSLDDLGAIANEKVWADLERLEAKLRSLRETAAVFDLVSRTENFYSETGKRLAGELHCERCGRVTQCDPGAASDHLRSGWPRCCGYTMTLVTKNTEVK